MSSQFRSPAVLYLFLLSLASLIPSEGYTQCVAEQTFINCGGIWNDANNWSPAGIPCNTTIATIGTSSNCTAYVNSNADYAALLLGNGQPGNVVIQNGGVLNGQALAYLGFSLNSGQSTVTIENGGVWNSAGILIGDAKGSTGQLNVNGTLNAGGSISVGNSSEGILNVNDGGIVTSNDSIVVGYSYPSPGTINVNTGGVITTTDRMTIGLDGSGVVNVAGTINANSIAVGSGGSSGTLNLGGGEVNTTGEGGMYVARTGTITGSGTIDGSVYNEGVVAPGSSTGTIYISNYTQGPDGTLIIEVESKDCYDQLRVDTAQLNGDLYIAPIHGYLPPLGTEYDIITAATSIDGTFSSVNSPEKMPVKVFYEPRKTIVLILPRPWESVGAVVGLTSNMKDILFNVANTQYGQITTRLGAIRAGVGNISIQGINQESMSAELSKNEKRIADQKGKMPVYAQPEPSQWSIFAAASGIFSNIKSIHNLPRLCSNTGYFGAGTDYRINQCANVGMYAGYQGTKARYNNNNSWLGGSWIRSNGVKFGLYGTAIFPGFSQYTTPTFHNEPRTAKSYLKNGPPEWNDNLYINGIIGGGVNCFNLSRAIKLGHYHWGAKSHPFAGELDSLLGGGYEFNLGPWRIGANTSLQYTYLGFSSFTETGAIDNLRVRLDNQNFSSLVYTLGANLSYLWQVNPNITIIPTIGLYWQHEFLNYGQTINGNLTTGRGGVYGISTTAASRNNAFGTLGFTAAIGSHISAFAYYNPQFGGCQITSQGIIVGLSYAF